MTDGVASGTKEIARIHVSAIPEMAPSDEFDIMAKMFGYERRLTCEGCEWDDGITHYAFCAGCVRDPLLEDKWNR